MNYENMKRLTQYLRTEVRPKDFNMSLHETCVLGQTAKCFNISIPQNPSFATAYFNTEKFLKLMEVKDWRTAKDLYGLFLGHLPEFKDSMVWHAMTPQAAADILDHIIAAHRAREAIKEARREVTTRPEFQVYPERQDGHTGHLQANQGRDEETTDGHTLTYVEV